MGAALCVALLAGCERPEPDAGPRVLELTHDTIHLAAGVTVHDITVRRAQGGEFVPASLDAAEGDVIRFTADDHAGHAIAFDGTALAADARAYLEQTGQLRSPPLIASGSTWVLIMHDAPPGTYPFRCTTHDVSGSITIVAR